MNTQSHSEKRLRVKRGHSDSREEARAVEELAEQIVQPDASLACVFASSEYNLSRLGKELDAAIDCPLIGCTTAGEITPAGYGRGNLTGFSLASSEMSIHPYFLPHLSTLDAAEAEDVVRSTRELLAEARRKDAASRGFGVLLVDGLSLMEEQVTALLAGPAGNLPIVGGSAGDDLKLRRTYVYHEGRFVSDAALFTLFITTLPFVAVKTQHFVPTDERLVVTGATPQKRVVHEINGRPAAEEYARVVEMDVKDLEDMVYSIRPLMLRIGGEDYVRSVQRVNSDGSLTFYSAIEEGLVLRVAEGRNFVSNLEGAFSRARESVPEIGLTIGFDCILRRLEVDHEKLHEPVNEILKKYQVIGFNTYGEQFNAIHVNQTFTGIILGES
jgi:hypothetical protein